MKDNKGPKGKINKSKYASAYITIWDSVANNWNTNRKHGVAESLMHPEEEYKYEQPEQSKEEVLQAPNVATISKINSGLFTMSNTTHLLNDASLRRILVGWRNSNKENLARGAILKIIKRRKWLTKWWLYDKEDHTNPTKHIQPIPIRRCASRVSWINPSKYEGSHQCLRDLSPPYNLRGDKTRHCYWEALENGAEVI